jgi:hypothetical protein
MDVVGDSDDGDTIGCDEGDVFKQAALMQHRVNELFGFEPENEEVETIRQPIAKPHALVKASSSRHPRAPMMERVEARELNHRALEPIAGGAGREVEDDCHANPFVRMQRRYTHKEPLCDRSIHTVRLVIRITVDKVYLRYY